MWIVETTYKCITAIQHFALQHFAPIKNSKIGWSWKSVKMKNAAFNYCWALGIWDKTEAMCAIEQDLSLQGSASSFLKERKLLKVVQKCRKSLIVEFRYYGNNWQLMSTESSWGALNCISSQSEIQTRHYWEVSENHKYFNMLLEHGPRNMLL